MKLIMCSLSMKKRIRNAFVITAVGFLGLLTLMLTTTECDNPYEYIAPICAGFLLLIQSIFLSYATSPICSLGDDVITLFRPLRAIRIEHAHICGWNDDGSRLTIRTSTGKNIGMDWSQIEPTDRPTVLAWLESKKK
jgi:hypothetical protein